MENGGRFADNQVDQLQRLGGGGVVSADWHCAHIHQENCWAVLRQCWSHKSWWVLIEVAQGNERKIRTLMSMYSTPIAQFYRVNTLYIWLKQHYSTRIWIICYSSFNSVMTTPDVQTGVLLIRARPFQNVCCNNVGNWTHSKFISIHFNRAELFSGMQGIHFVMT